MTTGIAGWCATATTPFHAHRFWLLSGRVRRATTATNGTAALPGLIASVSGGGVGMPDVLIRGLSEAAVARIDGDARAQGLSRNEYLRRRFEAERSPSATTSQLTIEDLRRAAQAAKDLDNPLVMGVAWR